MSKTRYYGFGVSGLALAAALTAGAVTAPGAAMAQKAPVSASAATNKVSLDIPAGPLSGALRQLADAAGVQLLYPSALTEDLRTPGLHGSYTVSDAVGRLLAGTGLTYHFTGASTVTLEPPPVAGARTLGAVQVEGVQSTGLASLDGFGAGAGSNGSSDPTATEGTGSLTTNGATVASKAPQALKDTPQSVTVITQELIQQQDLTDLTSALNDTPGITLDVQNSLRSTFLSRGFLISVFQVDGGAPLDLGSNSLYTTTPNLAEYDNVQVLRGSDALFGGASQPGGVVSLDRKRPLDHEQFLGEFDAGSWNNYLVQADVTGPIAFDGHLRARLVFNDQDRDFFYETAHQNKAFVYGVVEGDLDSNTLVRAGFSYERQTNSGFDSSGLPRYSDGGDLDLPPSTSFAAPWNRLNISTTEYFAALEHKFSSDWGLKINFTGLKQSYDLKENGYSGLVYRDNPNAAQYGEQSVNEGNAAITQYAVDATMNGAFLLFGRKQKITAGADYSLVDSSDDDYASYFSIIPINVFDFNPSSLNPEPPRPPLSIALPFNKQEQWGAYVNMNLEPLKNLHVIGGVRLSNYWIYTEDEFYFGSPTPLFDYAQKNHQLGVLTPYAAATYAVTPEVSLYASYADIFQAQGEDLDPSGKPLPPVTGATYETGIKGAFSENRLNASLSIYYTDESNQALPYFGTCLVAPSCDVDTGVVISSGVDLEVAGQILPGWQIQTGYTYNVNRYNQAFLDIHAGDGLNATYQTQQPNHQVKLWTAYTPTGRFSRWTVGGGLRLESARYSAGSVCSVPTDYSGYCGSGVYVPYAFTQGLYAVVDLRVAYKLNEHWQAALNLNNIGDTRYYATAGTNQSGNFYGEPRAFMFTIRAKY